MPLMSCPDCGKEISDSAISCPNCGLPRPYYELQSRARKQLEVQAHEDHAVAIRNWYIGAGVCTLGAIGLLSIVIVSPWTMVALGTKLKEAGVAMFVGGIGWFAFKHARMMGANGPRNDP